MVDIPFGLVYRQSNGPINSDLTESWWTCALQEGCVFGPFGWTKGGPYKHKLTEFYTYRSYFKGLDYSNMKRK